MKIILFFIFFLLDIFNFTFFNENSSEGKRKGMLGISVVYAKSMTFTEGYGSIMTGTKHNSDRDKKSLQEHIENNFILKKTISSGIDKLFIPLFNDVYKIFIKDVIILIKRRCRRRKVLRKIGNYLRTWWKKIFEKMTDEVKFSTYAKKKLRKCFYDAGISAYKKTVMDFKINSSELFFTTLIEFKEVCLIPIYGVESYAYERFLVIENNVAFLNEVKKAYPVKKDLKNK